MTGAFQFGGLISGLDTNKIIDALMGVERQPLVALQRQQANLQNRKAAYADLTTKLNALKSQTFNLTLATSSTGRTATSSSTSVLTASANSNAAVGTYTVNVTRIATKASITSGTAGTTPTAIGAAATGATLLSSNSFNTTFTGGKYTISVGGVSHTFDTTASSLGGAYTDINSALADINNIFGAGVATIAGNKITLNGGASTVNLGQGGDTSNFLSITNLLAQPAGTSIVSGSPIGVAQASQAFPSSNLATAVTGGAQTLTINGVNISYNGTTDTINTVLTAINNSAAGVTATYDATTDRVTINANNTGAVAISMSDTGNLLTALRVNSGAGVVTAGQNAQYDLNDGTQRFSTSNVISNAITGVSLTLVGAGTSTLTVGQDVTSTVNAVQSFVSAYNTALGALQQDTAIDPATNKGSIFTGDSFISGIMGNLQAVTFTAASIGTTYKDLPAIGISTGPWGSQPGTTKQLVLDTGKLTAALTANPNAVTSLLTAATASNGPLANLNSYLNMITTAGQGLDASTTSAAQQISDIGNRINDLQDILSSKQAALVQKFSDLEQMMAKLQAQSSQMASQLGSLSSSGR